MVVFPFTGSTIGEKNKKLIRLENKLPCVVHPKNWTSRRE
jgi:hypothetical protein